MALERIGRKVFAGIILLAPSSCQKSEGESSYLRHSFSEIARTDDILPSEFERASCVNEDYLSVPGNAKLNQMRDKARSYIKGLANGIMMRVNESLEKEQKAPVFTGPLSPENLCVGISEHIAQPMNASMHLKSFNLTIMPSIIENLTSESAIGGVICHELAHASMRHYNQAIRPDLEKRYLPNENDRKRLEMIARKILPRGVLALSPEIILKMFGKDSINANRMIDLQNEMNDFIATRLTQFLFGQSSPADRIIEALYLGHRNMETYNLFAQVDTSKGYNPDYESTLTTDEKNELDEFLAKGRALHQDTIGNDPSTGEPISVFEAMTLLHDLAINLNNDYDMGELSYINWRESEADQVGLEICLRAGLNTKDYDQFHRLSKNFRHQENNSQESNLEQCLAQIDRGQVPSRFSATHPDPCWRIFDVSYREPQFHSAEFDHLTSSLPESSKEPIQERASLDEIKTMIDDLRSAM